MTESARLMVQIPNSALLYGFCRDFFWVMASLLMRRGYRSHCRGGRWLRRLMGFRSASGDSWIARSQERQYGGRTDAHTIGLA